jgi:hypothetical protein
LHGRTILLHVEQGFGDIFQFIRYVPQVRESIGKVIVECHPPLVRVLRGVQGIDSVVALGSPLPAFDVQTPLVSLPRIFGTTLATVPASIPYLHADADLVEQWREKQCEVRGAECGVLRNAFDSARRTPHVARVLKVGIAWQGNPTYRADRQRSIPLAHFAPLADVPGVQLISLQKGKGADQLGTWPGQHAPATLGNQFDEESGAFMDTAAVMKNLDLVITSDTAVAHIAGALAVPVWVPLALVPDWRWLLEREDCPWYPTMRLFRQKHFGRWEEVFHTMAGELMAIAAVR